MNYKEAIEFVEQANQYSGEMGLDAIKGLLEELGNPHRKLKYVHVGGTNGKGSVCTYISSVLVASGYKVGRYISPVIKDYKEKIQTVFLSDGKIESVYVSEKTLIKHIEKIRNACERIRQKGKQYPSAFEIETVLGFLVFLEEACDLVVLEVGMGGRLDATNVIEESECTVLASISMDHKEYLGETLGEIAKEKSGIVKNSGLVVAYDYYAWSKEQGVKDTISMEVEKQCKEKHATATFADFAEIHKEQHNIDGIWFDYKGWKDLYTPLLGENQVKNAVVALEALFLLQKKGWNITEAAVYEGLKQAKWQGRFEIIKKSPYYVLDGAHNVDAAKSLAKSIDIYFKNKKRLFIMGMLADKDYRGVLEQVGSYADRIITITPDNPRALPAEQLLVEANAYCKQVEVGKNVNAALERAREIEKEYDVVFIFGSLYSQHLVYEYMEKHPW